MKKIILITAIFSLFVSTLSAQRGRTTQVKWLNLELKGGFGGSRLQNSDVINDDNADLSVFSPTYEFGARLGLTYGDYIGLGVEMLSSGFNQDYNISSPLLQAYTKTQKFKTSDIVISLRYTSLYGFYFELGPKFSTMKKAEVSNSIDESFQDENDSDYKQHFSEKFTSIIAGFGVAAHNGDRLRVYLGLRASFALSKFVEDDNFYVIRDGFYNPQGNFEANTNPFSLKFTVGINYIFGFWGNATCGRGRLVFFQ